MQHLSLQLLKLGALALTSSFCRCGGSGHAWSCFFHYVQPPLSVHRPALSAGNLFRTSARCMLRFELQQIMSSACNCNVEA